MNTDFILQAKTVKDMLFIHADEGYRERSAAFMRFLGIGDATRLEIDNRGQPTDTGALDRLRVRAAAALMDRSESRAQAVADELRAYTLWDGDLDADMDVVTAGWLERLGLSAPELYLLTSFGEETYIERRDGARVHGKDYVLVTSNELGYLEKHPSLAVTYTFEPGCWWHDGELEINEAMMQPETVRTAAIGRPLREIFSHPHLDGHDIRIVDWDYETTIFTDAARVKVFPR